MCALDVAGLAAGMGIGNLLSIIGDYAKFGITWAKWKTVGRGMTKERLASCLQALLEVEGDGTVGISTRGSMNATIEFIDRTLDLALIIDETIAHQLWQQIIHQSIAYAIHSSHGASIGTVANVFSGSQYLATSDSRNVIESSEFMDKYSKAFLCAEIGQNIPSMTFNAVRGANDRLSAIYTRVVSQISTLLDEWNDLALNYYRHYNTMARTRFEDAIKMKETVVDHAYQRLNTIANTHLSRIAEQLDSLDGAKGWFDAGLIDVDSLKNIAITIDLETQISQTDYAEMKTEINNAINIGIANWTTYINTALLDLQDSEYQFCVMIKSIFNQIFSDVESVADILATKANEAINDVCAYRNLTQNTAVSKSIT